MSDRDVRAENLRLNAELHECYMEIDRLRSEAWLMRHREAAKRSSFGRRCWGISSDAMAWAAICGEPVQLSSYPADAGDLAACERTYRMAPDHLRPSMARIMIAFRAHVARSCPDAVERVAALVDTEDRP
jgi:hypothetical protein